MEETTWVGEEPHYPRWAEPYRPKKGITEVSDETVSGLINNPEEEEEEWQKQFDELQKLKQNVSQSNERLLDFLTIYEHNLEEYKIPSPEHELIMSKLRLMQYENSQELDDEVNDLIIQYRYHCGEKISKREKALHEQEEQALHEEEEQTEFENQLHEIEEFIDNIEDNLENFKKGYGVLNSIAKNYKSRLEQYKVPCADHGRIMSLLRKMFDEDSREGCKEVSYLINQYRRHCESNQLI